MFKKSKQENITDFELLRRSINAELFGLQIFDILCKLSLHVDDLTDRERHIAQNRYKQYVTILPSKNGGYYLYMNPLGQGTRLEQQAGFWKLVREENNFRKEHSQNLIKYNIDKIKFFLEV